MRVFPAAFITEKNKKTGLAPVWILKLTVAGIVYWLSDNRFSVINWNGTITTLAWIKSWGQLQEGISGGLDEFHVSDFSCSCLIDPDPPLIAMGNNMESLASLSTFEQSACELYLWFHGLDAVTNPPQPMWRGYVKDVAIPDDLTVDLQMEDETARLNNYVGTKLNVITHPLADPDDIGKVIPIVYGTVTGLPALCVDSGWVTSIIADIAATSTAITVSELPTYSVVNRIITIDDEQIYITAVNGKILIVTRGYSGTIKVVHTKGSTVIEKKGTPLVYLVADHAVDSIGTVMARVRGVDIDITTDVVKYKGIVGNQLGTYPGKAAITVADFAKVQQRISIALAGGVSASDPGHGHNAGSSITTLSASQSGTGTSTTYGYANVSMTAAQNIARTYFESVAMSASFSAIAATILTCSMTATVTLNGIWDSGTWYLKCGGKRVSPIYTGDVSNFAVPITHDSASMQGNVLSLVIGLAGVGTNNAWTTWQRGYISAAARSVTYTNTSSVVVAPAASAVTVTSTLNISGNSVADIMLGDMLLVDVTRNITTPAAVIQDLLTKYGGGVSLTTIGTMPAGYYFNGAITEYKKLLEWCNILAFQCRSRFRMNNGTAQMAVMLTSIVPIKTIPQCVQNAGERVLSRSKAPVSEVINKIIVLYGRDWTRSGDDAYLSTNVWTDAPSIAIHGTRERPELFKFDFVTSLGMAEFLIGFYISWFSKRRWLHTFDTYLDHCELEYNDHIAMGFLNNKAAIITEARLNPGESTRMDKITFVAEA